MAIESMTYLFLFVVSRGCPIPKRHKLCLCEASVTKVLEAHSSHMSGAPGWGENEGLTGATMCHRHRHKPKVWQLFKGDFEAFSWASHLKF